MSKQPRRPEFQRNGRHFNNPEDLVGSQVGQLQVVSFSRKVPQGNRNSYYYWCACSCGQQVELTRWKLITRHTGSCGCRKTRRGTDNPGWSGYGEISGKFWADNIARAKKRRVPFEVSIETGWLLFEQQDRCCALTGEPLEMADLWDQAARKYGGTRTASLDRIDSTKGYIEGNVQWVHKDINRIKSDLPEDRFVALCRAVASHCCKPEGQ